MIYTFASDNTSGVAPEILEAIVKANGDYTKPYGGDEYTKEAVAAFAKLFGDKAEVFFVLAGTAANVIGLNPMLHSWNSILCSEMAHILTTESGAVEASIGCRLTPIPTENGKIQAKDIVKYLDVLGTQHHNQPAVVSITQTTEVGTLYTVQELKDICKVAHDNNLLVHMDGARLSNAVAALKCDICDITRDAGVDVLSFGGTKNGLMFGEAIVFFDTKLCRNFLAMRKQCLHLYSKMRFLSSQFVAYLENDMWLKNAQHANAMAAYCTKQLEEIKEISFAYKVEANGLFVMFPEKTLTELRKKYYFCEWEAKRHIVRLMFSFDTPKEAVDELIADIKKSL